MTAWIWLLDKDGEPYNMGDRWHERFDVESVAQARAIAADAYPDAPELVAFLVIDCEYADCGRRTRFSDKYAKTLAEARALAADPVSFHGGWYQGLYRGRMADICQWHYEVDPASRVPLPVGTLAARRRAAAAAPVGGEQLDLFGGVA